MLPIAGVMHLSTEETAARLGVSESRVRQLKMERRLRPHQLGPRNFFHPQQVETVRLEMEAARNAPPKPPKKQVYKSRAVARSHHKNYVAPRQVQEARRKRLVRVNVRTGAA